jgi:hypothetical protein
MPSRQLQAVVRFRFEVESTPPSARNFLSAAGGTIGDVFVTALEGFISSASRSRLAS